MKITINRKDLKSEHHIDTPLIDLALNDEAKTATTDRRAAFKKMIEDYAKGLFEIIIVHKLDRFA